MTEYEAREAKKKIRILMKNAKTQLRELAGALKYGMGEREATELAKTVNEIYRNSNAIG